MMTNLESAPNLTSNKVVSYLLSPHECRQLSNSLYLFKLKIQLMGFKGSHIWIVCSMGTVVWRKVRVCQLDRN